MGIIYFILWVAILFGGVVSFFIFGIGGIVLYILLVVGGFACFGGDFD